MKVTGMAEKFSEQTLVSMVLARHGEVFPDEIKTLVIEITEHRSTMARLEAWATELESSDPVHGVGKFIAAELRNRIKGDVHG